MLGEIITPAEAWIRLPVPLLMRDSTGPAPLPDGSGVE
jgi:hypothetical protein